MAKLYEAGEGENGCPGEDNCETFQSSAEDSEVRCPSCPKRAVSSPDADEDQPPATAGGSDIVDLVERLVRERDSGFGYPEDLTQLEKELVMVWDDTVATFERAYHQRTAMMLEALMGMAK